MKKMMAVLAIVVVLGGLAWYLYQPRPEPAAEVPPAGGTLLVFRRTRVSWHGHKRFVGERRMLQLNFIRNSRMARYTQQAARFSTRMGKRLARIAQPGQSTGPDSSSNT